MRCRPMTATIETLSPDPPSIDELIRLLMDAIDGGASLGFMSDVTRDEAEAYWRKVIAEITGGYRTIWVARDPASRSIIGSVQLAFEQRRNGRHRAEVQKLLVLRDWRRRGIGSALMAAAEDAARARRISLLFLDTSEGKGGACALYSLLGYTHCGGIPGYALDPDGTPARNAIYYKELAGA